MAYVEPPSERNVPGIATTLSLVFSKPEMAAENVLDLLRSLVTQDY